MNKIYIYDLWKGGKETMKYKKKLKKNKLPNKFS